MLNYFVIVLLHKEIQKAGVIICDIAASFAIVLSIVTAYVYPRRILPWKQISKFC